MSDWFTEHAKQHLRDQGYLVIPRDRHVVFTQQFILPPCYALGSDPEMFVQYKLAMMSSAIGRHALAEGAAIVEDKTQADDVTGTERYLRVAMALVKPRAEDDKR